MILALESSCDETAVALFSPERGIVAEWVHTQMALHERHGGVVPDLATREHLRHFPALIEAARERPEFAQVDTVAVTQGPGLAACLAVGLASAKALGLALRVPVWGVNHLRAHAFSPFIALHARCLGEFDEEFGKLLPHLGLVVSGGNTLLVELDEERRLRVLSTTRDDAAGEALDKGAKLLGLGYPGGPLVEKLAREGDAAAYDFPRGLGGRRDNLEFSFSGLKTSLRYQLEKMSLGEVERRLADLCASYQQAVIDALLRKLESALAARPSSASEQLAHGARAESLRRSAYRSIGLSGGVANNRLLRESVSSLAAKRGLPVMIAESRHSGDNAGMIGFAAWADTQGVDRTSRLALEVRPSVRAGD